MTNNASKTLEKGLLSVYALEEMIIASRSFLMMYIKHKLCSQHKPGKCWLKHFLLFKKIFMCLLKLIRELFCLLLRLFNKLICRQEATATVRKHLKAIQHFFT